MMLPTRAARQTGRPKKGGLGFSRTLGQARHAEHPATIWGIIDVLRDGDDVTDGDRVSSEFEPAARRVSIGMPVYNGAQFIDEAIASIRAQTMTEFELIIADNASNDETVEICQRHASQDDRLTVLTANSNRGAAWNFNRIVPHAKTPYFKWAAHDDIIQPDYLARVLPHLDDDPTTVLAYPTAVDIDESGHEIGPIASAPYARQGTSVSRVHEFLSFDTACVETFGVMRTEVLRDTALIGPYTSADRTLLLELAIRGRFCEIDVPLMRRRQHDRRSIQASAQARNTWFDTSRRATFSFPRWRLLLEFHKAIGRAPCSLVDRARMRLALMVWAGCRWKSLARDLVAWSRAVLKQWRRDPYTTLGSGR